MFDLSTHDPNSVSNPNNNIFGLPTSEADARLVIVPVPWEVTVSYGAGTARAPESILKASLQIDLFDPEMPDAWKQGFYMRDSDRKILMKSDYLRKEAELLQCSVGRNEGLVDRTHGMIGAAAITRAPDQIVALTERQVVIEVDIDRIAALEGFRA